MAGLLRDGQHASHAGRSGRSGKRAAPAGDGQHRRVEKGSGFRLFRSIGPTTINNVLSSGGKACQQGSGADGGDQHGIRFGVLAAEEWKRTKLKDLQDKTVGTTESSVVGDVAF